MSKKLSNRGFGAVEVLVAIVVIALLALGGWYVWHNHQSKKVANNTNTQTSITSKTKTQTPPANTYAGWKTYNDTGYSQASGISIKYPSDWKANVGGKAFAWEILQQTAPQASINVRDIFLDFSKTAQQEWDNCPSADACGPAPGDTKLEGSSTTTNGLDTYSVKMQSSSGIYYATVIKGNKPFSNGTTVFVEFILNSTDATVLNTYKQIIASANFPS